MSHRGPVIKYAAQHQIDALREWVLGEVEIMLYFEQYIMLRVAIKE